MPGRIDKIPYQLQPQNCNNYQYPASFPMARSTLQHQERMPNTDIRPQPEPPLCNLDHYHASISLEPSTFQHQNGIATTSIRSQPDPQIDDLLDQYLASLAPITSQDQNKSANHVMPSQVEPRFYSQSLEQIPWAHISMDNQNHSAQQAFRPRTDTSGADGFLAHQHSPEPESSRASKAKAAPAQKTVCLRLKPGPKPRSQDTRHPVHLNSALLPGSENWELHDTWISEFFDIVPADEDSGNKSKQYKCRADDCGRVFPRKAAAESHAQTHSAYKPHICKAPNW